MKKIATLLLAAGLVFGAATGVSAIDFKAKGQWIMSFDYGQNHAFTGGNGRTGNGNGEDEFEARQRACNWTPWPPKPSPAPCSLKSATSSGGVPMALQTVVLVALSALTALLWK